MGDINETAKAILEADEMRCSHLFDDAWQLTHLRDMARFWLMKDEIENAMRDNWDVDHSDPGGEHVLEPLLAKIRSIACEHDWQTFGPSEHIQGTMDACMKCGQLGKSVSGAKMSG